ncbi:acyltransferase family protein [Acidisoma sp.]|uniref:acyltransferase family protein n=1 Tax=Acidisoma sp. TaxID=1872115 RepID=UPI003B00393C
MEVVIQRRNISQFEGLDGLRGIAALGVVFAHANGLFKSYTDDTSSYLVVDFFYILSGFVIAYAYSSRLDQGLSWSGFMRLRLNRLYPMLFVGVLVAGLVFLGRQVLLQTGMITEAVVLTVLSLSLLPVGLLYGLASYPIDNPIWSLFFEFVANGVYASPIRRIGRMSAFVLLGLAIVALTVVAMQFGTLSCLGYVGPDSFLAGFVRVSVPFSLGVAIWRLKLFERFPSIPFPMLALGLAIVFFFHGSTRWVYDMAAVLIVFPVIVCFGSRAHVGAFSLRLCHISRRGSYPLYILHMSVLRTVDMAYKMSHIRIGPFVPMCLAILLSLAVSWGFLRLYDEPFREWMARRRKNSRLQAARVGAT